MPQPYDEWPDEISWGGSDDEPSPSEPEDDKAERRRLAIRRGLVVLVVAGAAVFALDQGGLLSATGPAEDRASRDGQGAPTPGDGGEAAPDGTPGPSRTDLPAIAALPKGLQLLTTDRPPELPYAAGSVVHVTAEQYTFPDDWRVYQVEPVADGLVISASTPEGVFASMFRRPAGSTAPAEVPIARGGRNVRWVRVAVDPTGTQIAWTRYADPNRHTLQVTRVGDTKPYASIELDRPAWLQAWVADVGPLFSYSVDPDAGPVVYDVARDALLPIVESKDEATRQPGFLAYSPVSDQLLLAGYEQCEPFEPRDLPIESVRCVPPRWQAAAFSGAQPAELVAMLDGRHLLVLDSRGVIRMERFLPDGLVVQDVSWESQDAVLVLVRSDAGSPHILRCPVSESCSRAYDGAPGETVVLSH